MAAMVEVKCCKCKKLFDARVADRNRGWARFCSKSCKAKEQEARTGQYKSNLCRMINGTFKSRTVVDLSDDTYLNEDPSWDAHKDSF
jgi:phage FluMu protein Com